MDRRTIEGIEACRPGSADLHGLELVDIAQQVRCDAAAAQRYEQTQRRDGMLVAAMDKIPVPDGLADRIFERIQIAQANVNQSAPGEVVPTVVVTELPSHAEKWERKTSRRRWLDVTVGLAATILVAALIGSWLQPVDESSLESMAGQWLAELNAAEPDWQAMSSAPASLQVPDAIAGAAASWRRLKSGRALACRIENPQAGSAVLFVTRLSVDNLPASPPGVPQSTTGGQAIAYWKSGPLVYVLVVPGNARSYRSFLRSVPAAVA